MRKTFKCVSFSGTHQTGLEPSSEQLCGALDFQTVSHRMKQAVPKAGWRLCPSIQMEDFQPRRAGQHGHQGSHTEQRNAAPPTSDPTPPSTPGSLHAVLTSASETEMSGAGRAGGDVGVGMPVYGGQRTTLNGIPQAPSVCILLLFKTGSLTGL